MRNYYVPGDWNAICQRCGLKHKASTLRLEWTGLRVCVLCIETRHPQTLIRVPKESSTVPWSSPEATDIYISPGVPISTEAETFLTAEDGSFILTES